jgi:hypothetical protein
MTERYKKIRAFMLNMIDGLTTEQLNEVPAGFNNNIVWHLGHVVAAQQGVTYMKSGRELRVPQHIFDEFKSGSKPERYYSAAEIDNIKSLFFSTLDTFKEDLDNNYFKDYVPFTTRYGVELSDIGMVTEFLPYHEGLHIGFVGALKKLVTQ